MGITESAAYLKGLFDGYELDKNSKEGKIISGMLELLGDMADKIDALERDNKELHEYVEELDSDLGELEEEVYFTDPDDEDLDDEPTAYQDYEEITDDYIDDYNEIECPACGEVICFDDSLSAEDLICPSCGEKIDDIQICDGDCSSCNSSDCVSEDN